MRFVGFIWALPATVIVWAFYVIPIWMLKYIRFVGFAQPFVAQFELTDKNTWYHRAWSGWWGWGGPCVLVLHHAIPQAHVARVTRHELRHVWQGFVFGFFHYPIYGICYLWILWMSKCRLTSKHPYRDNPFELDARRHESPP